MHSRVRARACTNETYPSARAWACAHVYVCAYGRVYMLVRVHIRAHVGNKLQGDRQRDLSGLHVPAAVQIALELDHVDITAFRCLLVLASVHPLGSSPECNVRIARRASV